MIRIYAVKTEDLPSVKTLEKQIVIDVGDKKRAAWNRQPDHRARESVAGILLLQYAMEQAGCSPVGASLAYEAKGRPYLNGVNLDFSISHSHGVAVCAVDQPMDGSVSRIGVDVEKVRGRSMDSMNRTAARWFTEKERNLFSKCPQEVDFLRIWTGKEAVCKRSGEGISEVSRCDITDLPQQLCLTVYQFQDVVISLCHRADTAPAESIDWIKTEIQTLYVGRGYGENRIVVPEQRQL